MKKIPVLYADVYKRKDFNKSLLSSSQDNVLITSELFWGYTPMTIEIDEENPPEDLYILKSMDLVVLKRISLDVFNRPSISYYAEPYPKPCESKPRYMNGGNILVCQDSRFRECLGLSLGAIRIFDDSIDNYKV